MDKTPLYVRRLHVDRLYGIAHDGLSVSDLVPGINVIHGPNGQGKTTFGRGLHALIWPEWVREQRPTLSGDFSVGDAVWRVELDGAMVRHQREGADTTPPALPSADERARYSLSLHDLLQSDGRDFATLIARDAAGGMDVDEAARVLKFSSGSAPRSGTHTRAALDAQEAFKAERQRQEALQKETATIGTLNAERDEAAAARLEQEVLKLACEHAELQEASAEAARTLSEWPAALAHVRAEDARALRGHRQQGREAAARVTEAQQKAASASTRLAANAVARTGHSAPTAALRTYLGEVQAADSIIARKDDDLAGLRRQEEHDAQALGEGADLDRLAAVDLTSIGELNSYNGKAARLPALLETQSVLRRAEEAAGAGLSTGLRQQDAEEGARLLRNWLQAERASPTPGLRTATLGGAAACAVVGAALAFLVHPVALALLVPAVALVLLALRLQAQPEGASDAEVRYGRLGVGAVAWTREGVEQGLQKLERARADAVFGARLREQMTARLETLGDVEAMARDVAQEGQRVAALVGLRTVTEGVQLAYTVEALRTYQHARTQRVAAEAARHEAVERRARSLAAASALVVPFGLPPVADAASLANHLAGLEKAAAEAAAIEHELALAREQEASATREGAEAATAISHLFARLGLEEADGDEVVEDACRQKEAYDAAAARHTEARTRAEAAQQRLSAHPAYRDGVAALSRTEAEAALQATALVAARYDDLTARIATLEAQAGQAQAGHALETAAAQHKGAIDSLHAERDRMAAARLGALMASHALRVSRERQVPAVVRRASQILATITNHRYGLSFDSANGHFVAVDTLRDRGFALDELSSGTRVQVLLSVRVAFFEQDERGLRLPLVLDEVLANSDEQRAEAITAAVIGLCREGRQVFYLTSRPDEVAKWRKVAAEHTDVSCAFIPLGAGSGSSDPDARPHPSLVASVPDPEGLDHGAYGRALNVPGWSAYDTTGSLHVWYALASPPELHTVLSAGLTQLGPLLSAVQSGVAPALRLNEETVARLTTFSDALGAWQSAWRQGRGRPVLRETLEKCPAISGTFIDRVADYAAQLGGDGRALVNALRDGDIKGFRSKQADEVEAYLLEHGFTDDAPRLSEEETWSRVVERVGATCTGSTLSLADVRAFLGRVAMPPRPA